MRVYVFDGYAGMLKNIIDQLNFKQILFYIWFVIESVPHMLSFIN